MQIEIINTGTELMLGTILNTHQQWLCAQMATLGRPVARQVAVPDTGPAICNAIEESLRRADIIITTGGLGPTSDDITRDLIVQLLGRSLHEDAAVLANIAAFFAGRNRPMPERTRVQALVPDGAVVLANRNGTAPGLVIEVEAGRFRPGALPTLLIMLPGPPRELRPMFVDQVRPLLCARYTCPEYACRTVRTTGIGESIVEARVAPLLSALSAAGLELGYCARVGEVDVRFSCLGANAADVVDKAERITKAELGEAVFGSGDEALDQVVVRLLTERRKTLALAESCTGGHISNRITNVPGASAVFVAGVVSYANEAKQAILGVNPATIEAHGAVSEPTVREMAEGARRTCAADYALAVTGIAGPAGGTIDKPVGTVFIGLAAPQHTTVWRRLNQYDRETFKALTSQQALDLLRRELLGFSLTPP